MRSRPLKSNKDKKREFSKRKPRASLPRKRPRLLTRKKFPKSIRPSSLNLKLPELPRKLKSKSVSLSRRSKLRGMSNQSLLIRLLPLRSK